MPRVWWRVFDHPPLGDGDVAGHHCVKDHGMSGTTVPQGPVRGQRREAEMESSVGGQEASTSPRPTALPRSATRGRRARKSASSRVRSPAPAPGPRASTVGLGPRRGHARRRRRCGSRGWAAARPIPAWPTPASPRGPGSATPRDDRPAPTSSDRVGLQLAAQDRRPQRSRRFLAKALPSAVIAVRSPPVHRNASAAPWE